MKYLLTNQETERLKFRKLENTDFDSWVTLFNDPQTVTALAMDPTKTPQEQCEQWFEWTFNRYKNNLGGQNVLIDKTTNQIVGQCGLLVREIHDVFELEIAYSILPQYRKMGFASESAKKCRDFAFQHNFHHRLLSLIVPENQNSKKVAQKNGMQLKEQIIFDNKLLDLFEITQQQWQNTNPKQM